ncbi:MAG: cytochrome C [Hyphomicrobiales bacterium]|nr:MAG: cytochrome C [Hyphomicrobiales bacterium]
MKISLPVLLVLAVLAGGLAVVLTGGRSGGGVRVDVKLPSLSAAADRGRHLFADNCQACHGPHGAGSDSGPPLIHKIYKPNHHGDQAFHLAVQRGVRAHHWNFGNMEPVPDLGRGEVGHIIRYVRELQRANGIG